MKTLHVTLTDEFEEKLATQVRAAGFSDVSAYVETLLKADRQRLAKENLESELLRGLNSGPPEELTDEVWDRIQRNFERRLGERRSSGTHQ
jgi:Arc/MetJ-type ribon-helix-helix transcriptional regulator